MKKDQENQFAKKTEHDKKTALFFVNDLFKKNLKVFATTVQHKTAHTHIE